MKPFPINKEGNKAITIKRNFQFLREIELGDIKVDKKILHKTLNEKLWSDFTLDSEVRDKLLGVAQEFYDFLGIKTKENDILLTGSLANYNYTEFSDVDVHLTIDFEKIAKNKDLVDDFLYTKSALWDLKHKIEVKGFPVQLFAQDIHQAEIKTSGIFSLKDNKWLKKPSYENFEVDTESLKEKVKRMVDKIELLNKFKSNPEKLYQHAKKVKDDIAKMRQNGLQTNGEYSLENLAFKYLRNNNYIDKIKNTIDKSIDKIYSLNT